MKKGISFWIGLSLSLLMVACVDRIKFDVGEQLVYPVVIEGSISDEPGPYEVKISLAFDIEDLAIQRKGFSAKKVVLSDNVGNSEELEQSVTGTYLTNRAGIKGVVGRAYTLRVELYDGRIYETVPDTLKPTGNITGIRHEIVATTDDKGKSGYAFDIFFDSDAGENKDFQFMWKSVMTYKLEAYPAQNQLQVPCNEPNPCFVPDPLPCSGVIFNSAANELEPKFPCECCICYVGIKNPNEAPIIIDNELVQNGTFKDVAGGRLPITGRTMQFRTRVEIQQYSLSPKAYKFWSLVKAQKEATSSLFQPISGQIIGNFVQVAGRPGPLDGLFYATSVKKSSIYLTKEDIPDPAMIPKAEPIITNSCTILPGASTTIPENWID